LSAIGWKKYEIVADGIRQQCCHIELGYLLT
jgi:hypothetical protein